MTSVYAALIFCVGFVVVCSDSIPRGIPNYFPSAFLRKGHTDNFVAFSVGLTRPLELHQPINITYDRIFLNMGAGYDNNTGIFTCPHAGTYVFLFHGLTQQNQKLWLDIYRNGDYIATGYAHTTSDYRSASNAVVLSLDEFDDVYIQARGDNFLYGASDEVYTTFNGFMIIPNVGRTQNQNQGNVIG